MFDWSEFENLAARLRNGDEAAQRSAISRLYYLIYHRALAQLEQTSGFVYSVNKPAHQQVWDGFIRGGKTSRLIGFKGKELRDHREAADYANEIADLERLLADSFKLAEGIMYWLERIQPEP